MPRASTAGRSGENDRFGHLGSPFAINLGLWSNVVGVAPHFKGTSRYRWEAAMRRRDVLAGAGSLATGAAFSFPAPAIAQGLRQLKMVTDWPEGPGFYPSAVRFAQTVEAATGGRINIEVFLAGGFVGPFETFDAVSAGVADMYHTYEGYFVKKSPAFQFFAAIPYGFTADELFAWVHYGGGQELWDA